MVTSLMHIINRINIIIFLNAHLSFHVNILPCDPNFLQCVEDKPKLHIYTFVTFIQTLALFLYTEVYHNSLT